MVASGLPRLMQQFELSCWRFWLFVLCLNLLVRTGCAVMMLTGQGVQ